MEKQDDVIVVDLSRLIGTLWRKVWAIILVMIILGGLSFGITVLFISPKYEASVMLYVNSNSGNDEKLSISQSELTTAQSLVDTYIVILNTRSTLSEVMEKAGVIYEFKSFEKMLDAGSVNSTELLEVVVTSRDPNEAVAIAKAISEVLPEKIAAIVEGSSTRIVDMPVFPTEPSSPNILVNVALGAVLGAFISCSIIIIKELMDDKIHGEAYLKQTYDLPILAVIPDLMATTKNTYGDYQKPARGKR